MYTALKEKLSNMTTDYPICDLCTIIDIINNENWSITENKQQFKKLDIRLVEIWFSLIIYQHANNNNRMCTGNFYTATFI